MHPDIHFSNRVRNIATMTPISKEIGGYTNRFTGANQRGIDGGKDMNQHLAHVANTTYGCDKKRADGREGDNNYTISVQ
jgi:hypothetical protein